MGPYNEKPVNDHAQELQRASLVEYAYITQTGVQSNPDSANVALSNIFKGTMATRHANTWKQAMDQDMGRLKENNVYELISRAAVPFNHKVIGVCWVTK